MTDQDCVEVTSREAVYRGRRTPSGDQFLGIRYACPPLEQLRFQAPEALENRGTIDAVHHGLAAAQIQRPSPAWAPRSQGFETGEDCLNLNIYTPAADGGGRPVIVHAFGGGFQTGSAHGTYHDDAGFSQRGDVVLVRPNMRTGALGFLHLAEAMGDQFAAANRGLLDFVMALQWVHDNISAFGGDPDNVTLVGLSSGAFTISALFGMDDVAHLFHHVWLMSGPASRIIALQTAAGMAEDFLHKIGIRKGDAAALQEIPLDMVLTAQDQIVATHLGERNAPGGRTLGIVLDEVSLVRHPLNGLETGHFVHHPSVLGWTRDEARLWYTFGIMPEVEDRATLVQSIARFHPHDAEDELTALETEQPGKSFTDYEEIYLSRAIYRDPALRTAATHAKAGGTAYAYEFAYIPSFEGRRLGASHGSDEPFVFGNVEPGRVPTIGDDPHAGELAAQMNQALYQFARTGTVPWDRYDDATGLIKTYS